MNSAAEQLDKNQGERASGSQQQAMETLTEMLEGLESIERAKVQRLRRDLASLVQSIESLIAQQGNELNALFASGGHFAQLIDGMYQLNVNTYSVQEMARKAGRELVAVSGHLESAARAQADVIDSMRESVADAQTIESGEQRSLESLRAALDVAQELQEQLANDEVEQQREELIKAYRALYERELALAGETRTLAQDGELDRRDRIRAQQLGREQTAIRTDAAQMLIDIEGLADSILFKASHSQIDHISGQVSDSLLRGAVGPIVQMREGDVADRFAALAMALEESQSQDEFAQPGSGSSGGGGSSGAGPQPLVPPAAQLKLLRSLQDSVYRSTRSLDDFGVTLDATSHTERLGEIGDSQAEIADLAEQLINELLRNNRGNVGPQPVGPGGQEP